MQTINQIQVKWTSLVTAEEVGMYQIIADRLQVALCLSADANIALAYLRPKLAAIGWVLPKDAPLSAVPSHVMACHDAFGGDNNGT